MVEYDIIDGVLIIPEGTEFVDEDFNSGPDITSIIIPASVRFIDVTIFEDCTNLASIVVSSDNELYDSRDNCNAIIETESNILFFGCKNAVIPDSVTEIDSAAFDGCTGLTSIVIPNSVTKIGDGAFRGCKRLTSIVIPDSVTEIGAHAFNGCSALTNIVIPDSVTEIGVHAFDGCPGLNGVSEGDTSLEKPKQKDGPQTVEVRVWTNSLTCLNITPTCDDNEKVMNLLSEGDFDDSTEEAVRELQEDMGYTEVLFVNGDDGVQLTVDDGKDEIKRDSLPVFWGPTLMEYAYAMATDGEVTEDNMESGEVPEEEEQLLFNKILKVQVPENDGRNRDFMKLFLNWVKEGKVDSNGFHEGYLRHVIDSLHGITPDEEYSELALLSFGEIGKGIVKFAIEIPEGEQFDINKLHFIWDGDWWDTYIAEECDGFSETFKEHDIMLDCVEYDGRIYHRTEWEFVPGWKYYGGTVLVYPYLQVAEL